MNKVHRQILLHEEHDKATDKEALNLSKYVRQKLEQDYPEHFQKQEASQ